MIRLSIQNERDREFYQTKTILELKFVQNLPFIQI